MLRKSLVAILILLYSATAIGVPLHLHYCQGELMHITVLVKVECGEPETGMEDQGCCQNKKPNCHSGNTLNNCCDDATQWLQDDLLAICQKSIDGDTPTVVKSAIVHNNATIIIQDSPSVYPALLTSSGPPLYIFQCALVYYG